MAKCMYPYMVERKVYFSQEDRYVPVPCGKCPDCLKRRVAAWSQRLMAESLRWETTHFLTLTYDTDHVPISPNGFMTLDNPVPEEQPNGSLSTRGEHVTLFLKRIRKYGKCRYYYCGEYGTHNKRPHYHMILFADLTITQTRIIDSWPYGAVYFGDVSQASVSYTVQYFDKGVWRPAHKRDDRKPEFSRMSNGIGKRFMTEAMRRYMLANPGVGFIYNANGHKIAIPRYYKKLLYDQSFTSATVAENPSLLIYRDEMLEARDIHHKAVALYADSIPVEEDSQQRNEDRRAAIENYRESKRKTRR